MEESRSSEIIKITEPHSDNILPLIPVCNPNLCAESNGGDFKLHVEVTENGNETTFIQ